MKSEGILIMKNVHVVVDSGAKLGLIAKGGIRFTRDKVICGTQKHNISSSSESVQVLFFRNTT